MKPFKWFFVSVLCALVLSPSGNAASDSGSGRLLLDAQPSGYGRSYSPPLPLPDSIPTPSRWMDPLNRARLKHHPPSIDEPLQMEQTSPRAAEKTMTGRADAGIQLGRICIVVHREVQSLIQEGLAQYEADLKAMGYGVIRYLYSLGPPEDIRRFLQQLQAEPESLVGAIFIGEIPHIVFEAYDKFGQFDPNNWTYTDFPCDLFYMDLDGEWLDVGNEREVQAGNGKYDSWIGDQDLEIWVSRLKPAHLALLNMENLPSADFQARLLNAYFSKNHRYRFENKGSRSGALVYDDDDWQYFARQADGTAGEDVLALSLVYDFVRSVWKPERTTSENYKKKLLMPSAPQLILLRSHGSSGGHIFFRDKRTAFDNVFSKDYLALDSRTPFFSLYTCAASDYTEPNNLADVIVLNPDGAGLLAWGTTKLGGMWNDRPFYEALSQGHVFGEAFRLWFNQMLQSYPAPLEIVSDYWYGMVLTGDAALKPVTASSPTGSLTVHLSPPEAVAAGARWNVDGGPWRRSGETASGLSVLGAHTIHFNPVRGWDTPEKQNAAVSPGLPQTVSGAYSPAF